MADNWIAEATAHHKGALRETAKRDGLIKGDEALSYHDLKELSRPSNSATTRRRAELAKTLKGMHE